MDRIVVITGASGGIGKKVAELFEKNSDTVINLSKQVDKEDERNILCDVSDEELVKKAFEQIKNKFGKIDILINNAGYGISGVTELIDSKKAHQQFNVNFFGVFYCTKYALKLMSESARIVNISSACALFPLPYRTLYCASKSAVSMLSKSMRMELAQSKIDMVAICPGDTKTNFTANRDKNFETNEKYGNNIVSATQKLDRREDKRMSPEYVAGKIYKIANSKKTKPEYIIGTKYKLFFVLSRLLPQKLFNKILEKMFSK